MAVVPAVVVPAVELVCAADVSVTVLPAVVLGIVAVECVTVVPCVEVVVSLTTVAGVVVWITPKTHEVA